MKHIFHFTFSVVAKQNKFPARKADLLTRSFYCSSFFFVAAALPFIYVGQAAQNKLPYTISSG